jgi:glutamate-1-semialdehyde 2,1-aminomutase
LQLISSILQENKVNATNQASDIGVRHGNLESASLLERAAISIPGGVNSVRRKIDPPICIRRGWGAYLDDVDGNRYIDFHAAYGPIVLGHRHPPVTERVREVLDDRGELFGIGVTDLEVELAEKIVRHVPSAEQVVICNTGTEATLHAIRLARAATARDGIVKFEGLYHGHHDYVLCNTISAPSAVGTRHPMSAGILPAAIEATHVCRFNDLESVRAVFDEHGDGIAAIILEPIAHNSPSILPDEGFLAGLREIASRYGALLIFDEVITGFRHGLGGYESLSGVRPDISTWGKAIANGYATAAVSGRRELLEMFNTTHSGTVTFAGSHNGNPVAMAAALGTIEVMEREPVHDHIFKLGELMRSGLREVTAEAGVPAIVSGFGSIYAMLFMTGSLHSYDDVARNDAAFAVEYRRQLIRRGIFEMPEGIGRNHISYSHTSGNIEQALEISRLALRATIESRGLPAGS